MESYTLSIQIAKHHNIKHNTDPEYRKTLTQEQGYKIDPDMTHLNKAAVQPWLKLGTDTAILKQAINNSTKLKQNLETMLQNYNHGKRKDRQLTLADLTNQRKKQHLEIYEAIIQIGNSKEGYPVEYNNLNKTLKHLAQVMAKNTPGLIPLSIAIHWDESTPHLHLTFTIASPNPNRKRGLPIDFSLDSATGGGRLNFAIYRDNLEQALTETAREHGYNIENPGLHLKHKDPKLYNMEKQLLERQRGADPFRAGKGEQQPLQPTTQLQPGGDFF